MTRKTKRKFLIGFGFLVAFIIWTLLLLFVDVNTIGAKNTTVGFSTLNGFFHNLIGTNMLLYVITDWLGLIPIAVALCFATLGLTEWIKRKSLLKVDENLFVLGGFYIVVIFVYALFETVTINYRPILINGYLEGSYPSSTTLLVTSVMPTAIMQLNERIKNSKLKRTLTSLITAFISFMVMGRIISGVHWISDIIGGLLFSISINLIYSAATDLTKSKKRKKTN